MRLFQAASWMLALSAPTGSLAAQGSDSTPERHSPASVGPSFAQPRRTFTAVSEALLLNVVVNRLDGWAMGHPWAQTGPSSWSRNLRLGWEWDENAFTTNMFAHPYHGGLYFNAGRANGLDFWQSAPLSFLGSATWEFFGETYRPSLNDFFMTSFGGVALGEVFHRIGASIRDNESHGGHRIFRELAALPLDPVGGFNRLVRGGWTAPGPNPPEHRPEAFLLRIRSGLRLTGDTANGDRVRSSATLLVDLDYGDPVVQPYRKPFDAFTVRLQVSSTGGINQLRASGRLFGRNLDGPESRHRHLFAVNQRFDYSRNPAQSFGAQGVEVGVLSRWRLPREFGLRTHVFGDGIFLGAIDAPRAGVGERVYDFGPGAGVRLQADLERRGITYVSMMVRSEFLHTISGATANHIADFGGLEINIPVAFGVGLGVHSAYYARKSVYRDGTGNRHDFPELRVYLSWTAAGRPQTGPGSQ